jgi:hypothetical protein
VTFCEQRLIGIICMKERNILLMLFSALKHVDALSTTFFYLLVRSTHNKNLFEMSFFFLFHLLRWRKRSFSFTRPEPIPSKNAGTSMLKEDKSEKNVRVTLRHEIYPTFHTIVNCDPNLHLLLDVHNN